MVLYNKIEAIKVLRSLKVKVAERLSENGVPFQSVEIELGLREAKDLVEAIMAIQPQDWQIVEAKEKLRQKTEDYNKLNDLYWKLRNSITDILQQ